MGYIRHKQVWQSLENTAHSRKLSATLLPLIVGVHAVSVSGHLLQFPVPALHPPGAVVTLFDQHLQQKDI